MSGFDITDEGFAEVASRLAQAGGDVEVAINEVLHGEAGQLLESRITPLIHPSGRTFKGHPASATVGGWASFDTSKDLEVTVAARGRWGYLYFPDDGSNTKRHAGEQHFMERGADDAAQEVMGLCMDNIIAKLEG